VIRPCRVPSEGTNVQPAPAGSPTLWAPTCTGATIGGRRTRRTVHGGVPIITISSTMRQPIPASELRSTAPAWRLKLIPRADRPEPAIKQLIDGASATTPLDVHVAYRGHGTVHFEPSPAGDFTALAPIEYREAFYFEASYSEGFATIVPDYLAQEE